MQFIYGALYWVIKDTLLTYLLKIIIENNTIKFSNPLSFSMALIAFYCTYFSLMIKFFPFYN